MRARNANKHWPQLDGLRGLAILAVMAYHFLDLLAPSYRPAEGLHRWTWAALGAGWVGVDLFFVLSGFLITGILWDSRGGEQPLLVLPARVRGYFRSITAFLSPCWRWSHSSTLPIPPPIAHSSSDRPGTGPISRTG